MSKYFLERGVVFSHRKAGNAHRIGIIGSINDSLSNTSSAPTPEVKK